jgi:hypothetical protein
MSVKAIVWKQNFRLAGLVLAAAALAFSAAAEPPRQTGTKDAKADCRDGAWLKHNLTISSCGAGKPPAMTPAAASSTPCPRP